MSAFMKEYGNIIFISVIALAFISASFFLYNTTDHTISNTMNTSTFTSTW